MPGNEQACSIPAVLRKTSAEFFCKKIADIRYFFQKFRLPALTFSSAENMYCIYEDIFISMCPYQKSEFHTILVPSLSKCIKSMKYSSDILYFLESNPPTTFMFLTSAKSRSQFSTISNIGFVFSS